MKKVIIAALIIVSAVCPLMAASVEEPEKIEVLILPKFENGEMGGDFPGEAQPLQGRPAEQVGFAAERSGVLACSHFRPLCRREGHAVPLFGMHIVGGCGEGAGCIAAAPGRKQDRICDKIILSHRHESRCHNSDRRLSCVGRDTYGIFCL